MLDTPVNLDLPYKGGRDYLHGTDLFNAMAKLGLFSESFGIRFYKPIHHPVQVESFSSMKDKDQFSAVAYAPARNPTVLWGVRELPDQLVTRRIPYPEDEAIAGAVVLTETATHTGPNSYTFIERLIALNKKMLQTRHPAVAKWLFSGIDLNRDCAKAREIQVGAAGGLGVKLVKSAIRVDGEPVGTLYFSGV